MELSFACCVAKILKILTDYREEEIKRTLTIILLLEENDLTFDLNDSNGLNSAPCAADGIVAARLNPVNSCSTISWTLAKIKLIQILCVFGFAAVIEGNGKSCLKQQTGCMECVHLK